MTSKIPTRHAQLLIDALEKRGIKVIPEYDDGFKQVDIYVPAVGMYIEVDGLGHYTNPDKIIQDFLRDHYSDDDGLVTKRIPNELIETHLPEIADAIAKIVKERAILFSSKNKI